MWYITYPLTHWARCAVPWKHFITWTATITANLATFKSLIYFYMKTCGEYVQWELSFICLDYFCHQAYIIFRCTFYALKHCFIIYFVHVYFRCIRNTTHSFHTSFIWHTLNGLKFQNWLEYKQNSNKKLLHEISVSLEENHWKMYMHHTRICYSL